MVVRLNPGDPRELVRLDLVLEGETFLLSDPVPRSIAAETLRMAGEQGVWIHGRRVTWALIRPEVP